MSRTSLQIDDETSFNLGVLAKHNELTKKQQIKQLVKKEMQTAKLTYKKMQEVAA